MRCGASMRRGSTRYSSATSSYRNSNVTIGFSMSIHEVVEAEGHLIDSHVMESIFDKVVEYEGRFEVEQCRIGRNNEEPSYIRLKVETADAHSLSRLLEELLMLG